MKKDIFTGNKRLEQVLKNHSQILLINKKIITMTLVKVNNPIAKSFDGLMNQFLNDFPSATGKTIREEFLGFPPVNIDEKQNGYLLQLAAPGFEKTDFTIKLEADLLTISAGKTAETKDETVKSIRKEFSNKSFKRSFTLDEKIDGTNIVAKYENGILNVEIPKKEVEKTAAKEIAIL